jgi:cytochrome c oxidase assembly protein subunit 15
MVASGLVDIPAVSHYRLTAHLLAALSLLALTFWVGMDNLRGHARLKAHQYDARKLWLLVGIGVTYLIQVSWGGLVAGLKAGFISNSWPLMGGRMIPPGMFQRFDPWFLNLVSEHVTVHFIHRWFAFVVLGLVLWLWRLLQREGAGREWMTGFYWLLGLVVLQIALGIGVVLFSVPISLASLHQTIGISIFLALLYLSHNVLRPPAASQRKQAKTYAKRPLPAS